MKLVVRAPGLAAGEKAIDIKNESATLANVRAVLAISFKLDAKSFRMTHPTADLETETVLLRDSGLIDGDVVTLVSKRARDDDGSATPADPAAAATVATEQRATSAVMRALPQINYDHIASLYRPLQEMGFSDAQVSKALQKNSFNVERATRYLIEGLFAGSLELPRKVGKKTEGAQAHTVAAEHHRRERAASAPVAADEEGDDADGEEDDDDWEDVPDSDDEMDEEQEELAELAMALVELTEPETLRERFLHDPQAVLREIQEADPRVFTLIGRHQQFFLDFVNEGISEEFLERYGMTPEFIADLDELADLEEEEGDEEGGEEEEGDEEEGEEEGEEEEEVDIRNLNLGNSRGGRFYGAAQQRPPPAGSPTTRGAWTPADNANVEQLMQLGFTREQCRAAYERAGRDVNRAAELLFQQGGGSL